MTESGSRQDNHSFFKIEIQEVYNRAAWSALPEPRKLFLNKFNVKIPGHNIIIGKILVVLERKILNNVPANRPRAVFKIGAIPGAGAEYGEMKILVPTFFTGATTIVRERNVGKSSSVRSSNARAVMLPSHATVVNPTLDEIRAPGENRVVGFCGVVNRKQKSNSGM